jgi:pseudaminic acid synthase
VLKCTSSYPAPINEANLKMMKRFSEDFDVLVGLSDHTKGNLLPILSIAMGATVIEKHFKLNDDVGGADASFSINETDFKYLVDQVRLAESAMGIETYELTDKQISGKRYGRSIYISNDVKKGEILTEDNIKCVRPGLSLHPKHYNNILGKKVKNDFVKGSRIKLENIQ